MAIIRTWVSLEGGYFEGTQAQLCKEYGIKHKTNLKRASGAPDNDGDRWMTKEQYDNAGFVRPTLYLGNKLVSNGDGTFTEVGAAGGGSIYLIAKEMLSNPHTLDEQKELAQGVVDSYDKIFEIIDNSPVKGEETYLNKITKEMYRWKAMRSTLRVQKTWANRFDNGPWTDEAQHQLDEVEAGMEKLFTMIAVETDRVRQEEAAISKSRAEATIAKRNAVRAMHKALEGELGRPLTLDEMLPACKEVGHTIYYVKNQLREVNKAKRAEKRKLNENKELLVA